jgi:hypothetical protein
MMAIDDFQFDNGRFDLIGVELLLVDPLANGLSSSNIKQTSSYYNEEYNYKHLNHGDSSIT